VDAVADDNVGQMILAVDMNLYCAALLLEISKSLQNTAQTRISPDVSPCFFYSNS
jgi:hypothetical protein